MLQLLQNSWWALALFGVFVGIFAGLFGLGGGAVLVPLMVLAFSFGQAKAQGTSLAMILSPSAAPAIYRYHMSGNVDWWFVLKVAPFMLLGSYFGAMFANQLPQAVLRMLFAFVLIYIAGYMVFSKLDSMWQAVGYAFAPAAVTVLLAWQAGIFTKVVQAPGPGDAPTAEAAEQAQ